MSCSQGQSNHSKKVLKTEIGNIKFDETITGFKFTQMLGKKFLYSPNGKKDINNNFRTSGYYILGVPNINHDNVKGYLQDFSQGYSQQEEIAKVADLKVEIFNTAFGKASVVTFTVYYKSKEKGMALQAMVSNGKDAILFVGEDYKEGKFIEKFKQTFKSIE